MGSSRTGQQDMSWLPIAEDVSPEVRARLYAEAGERIAVQVKHPKDWTGKTVRRRRR